jgi:hypothetical protein
VGSLTSLDQYLLGQKSSLLTYTKGIPKQNVITRVPQNNRSSRTNNNIRSDITNSRNANNNPNIKPKSTFWGNAFKVIGVVAAIYVAKEVIEEINESQSGSIINNRKKASYKYQAINSQSYKSSIQNDQYDGLLVQSGQSFCNYRSVGGGISVSRSLFSYGCPLSIKMPGNQTNKNFNLSQLSNRNSFLSGPLDHNRSKPFGTSCYYTTSSGLVTIPKGSLAMCPSNI